MGSILRSISLLSLTLAVAGAAACAQDTATPGKDARISQLERQLATLRESYAIARADADEARKQLREVRSRMEALGGSALGNREEKLIETAAQLESVRAELDAVRQSSLRLTAALVAYMRSALVEDQAARESLETAVRDLDVALGLRRAKADELAGGSVDEAKVLSIDSESGLIVINAGREGKVEVGMSMEISRGDQAIAMAVVTDVRKTVAGLLVQQHLNPALSVAVGDMVSVKSND
ncbi:MAG: hypothetical protein Q4E43_08430 [Akkermansia sp.]|nr:hypothetical protein [Akkermansia sp.]